MSPAVPLIVAWLGAAVLTGLDSRRPAVAWAAVGLLGATTALLAVLLGLVLAEGDRLIVAGDWPSAIGITLRADALGVVFALVSAAVATAAAAHRAATRVRNRGFMATVLYLTAGLTGLFLTADVFNFYVFFEIAMTAAYVLTTYGDEEQIGDALIFAVVNLLGTFLFLVAVAAGYHVTGTLDMADFAARIADADETARTVIGAAFFLAFATKLGLFPFHFWLPPAYSGASPAVAAILSGALANIGAYGILRFGGELLPQTLRDASTALIVLGCVSIAYGALQAVHRRDPAEVLAYSAIGQVGFVLVAVGVGGPVGFAAAVLYALVTAITKCALFLSVGLRGLFVAGAFAVGALSIAGVPPTAGFLAKLEIFRAGVAYESASVVALLFAGSALSFLYGFQLYQHEFWRGERGESRERPASAAARAVALAASAAVLVTGMWPEPLLAVSREAAAALGGVP